MTVARIEDVSNAFELVGQEYQEVKLAAGVTPEQFGVTGSGSDATTQLRQWMAEGGQKTALAGESYRAGTWLGQMSVAPSSRSTLAGSTIIQGYSLPNNTQMGVVGAGADVAGLSWQMDGSNYFRRGFRLDQGASLRASKLTSPTPSPAPAVGGYGTRGHVLGIFGNDARIEDVLIDGFQQQAIFASPDVPPVERAVVRNVEMRKYVAGFKGNNMPGALVDGIYARGIGPDAVTDPGHNLITGGSSHSVYKDAHQLGDGSGAGEHFVYSDGGDGVQGVRILGVTNWASGQCFIKLRGHDSFVVSDCHGGGIGLGNAPGTNEDVLRLEYCRNGVVSNLSMRPTVGRGGYDGIHINSCWNTRISNVSLAACERASVFICSAALSGYTSPPSGAVDGIRIEGIIADQKNGQPFLMFGLDDSATTTTVTVGNITITGIQWAGTRAQLYALASGATLVRLPGTRIHMSGQASDGPFSFNWAAADPAPAVGDYANQAEQNAAIEAARNDWAPVGAVRAARYGGIIPAMTANPGVAVDFEAQQWSDDGPAGFMNLYGTTKRKVSHKRVQIGRFDNSAQAVGWTEDPSPMLVYQKLSRSNRNTDPAAWDTVGYFGLHKSGGDAFGAALTAYARVDGGTGDQIGLHARFLSTSNGAEGFGVWAYAAHTNPTSMPLELSGVEINLNYKGLDIPWPLPAGQGLLRGLTIVTADGGKAGHMALSIGAQPNTGGWYDGIDIRADGIVSTVDAGRDTRAIRISGGTTQAKRYGGISFGGAWLDYGIDFTGVTQPFTDNAAIQLRQGDRIRWSADKFSTRYITRPVGKDAVNFNNLAIQINSKRVIGAQMAALPPAATDLATAITLLNALRAGVTESAATHGLFAAT